MKFESEIAESVYRSKYMLKQDVELIDPLKRIDNVVATYYPELKGKCVEYGTKRWVGFAGGLYRSARNENKNVSAINCTTLTPIEDTLESINDGLYWWAKFSAYGQGEGLDFSNLRPRGARVHNSSKESTGAVSFMYMYDAVLQTIAQNGRRGASLISLSVTHPDVLEFINVKDEEGVLESANISIQITDEFMNAVENDEKWELVFENKYERISKKIQARKLFHLIAEHAHKSGDPGLQFISTAKKYSNSDALGYEVVSTNACSEQWLDPHNVCLLSSINLAKYHEYGDEKYVDLINFMVHVLDAFRQEEIKENRSPSETQRQKLEEVPRIGLGVTGLADLFIERELAYGSVESIQVTESIFKTLVGESYKASYEVAKNRGYSFGAYNKDAYKKAPFVQRLLDEGLIEDYHLDYQAHVCKNTVAPNGSLGMILENGGSGIEPLFAKYFVRRERSTTGEWKEWFTFNDLVKRKLSEQGLEVTKENADKLDTSLWVTAHSLDSSDKLKLLSVVQKYIDSAVSVTYNLNKNASVEDVEKIYMEAWKTEAKGVTVYREGSKVGVMITEDNYESQKEEESVKRQEVREEVYEIRDNFAPQRPKDLYCDLYEISVNKAKMLVVVGLFGGDSPRPYEIFIDHEVTKTYNFSEHKEGIIRKRKKGCYDLIIGGEVVASDLSHTFEKEYLTMARLVSMAIRHGTPIQFVCAQLAKDSNFGSFGKGLSRVLKMYITEGEEVKSHNKKVCTECGGNIVFQSGCEICFSCGSSKCG